MRTRLGSVAAIVAGLLVSVLLGSAQATVSVSGVVFYDGEDRNLIYDDDYDITWLDYSKAPNGSYFPAQRDWASNLSFALGGMTYDSWRLPILVSANDGSSWGYDQTVSEMGHLYYTELGNLAGGPLTNTGDFRNLVESWYWTGTEYYGNPSLYWDFHMNDGYQSASVLWDGLYALAVHPGRVSSYSSVPEPATTAPVRLLDIHPHPGSGEMRIGFEAPEAARVLVTVLDPAGRVVRSLPAREAGGNRFESVWDCRDDSGARVASGAYFVRLAVEGQARGTTGRLLVIR